jgi:CRISPR-associated endonuclease Csy4
MNRYLEITIRPDPEFSAPMLLNALMSKLHRALVHLEADDVGISFPGYQTAPRSLGAKLRLHGTEGRLGALMETNWLKGMADHVKCSDLMVVPKDVQHIVVQRRQVKSNVERLRRRRMKRKGESYEQAVAAIPASVEQQSNLPFVTLSSQSTGEVFKLFIEQEGSLQEAREGSFNCYGLSQGASVPWF